MCVSAAGSVSACLHMCYISLWKQVKQIKVEQLSNNAGRGSKHPELAAIITIKATGSGKRFQVF